MRIENPRSCFSLRVRPLLWSFGLVAISGAASAQIHEQSLDHVPASTLDEQFVASRIDGATDPDAIPDSVAIQMFADLLSNLRSNEEAGAIQHLKEAMVLTDDEFDRLAGVADTSREHTRAVRNAAVASLCQRSEQFLQPDAQAGAQALSAELSRTGRELESERDRFFKAELRAALGESASERVLAWINANLKPTLTVVDFDTQKRAVVTGANPVATFQQNCRSLLQSAGSFTNSSE